jgi:phage shock protein B
MANGVTEGERADIEEMIHVANKMAGRIETLESILDVESPGWREKDQR